ncbi:Hypothetical_protein [Hexamita inflata]|uniref:Hypothetical_protein n=1 Tax=Hexamita inflata TaxID=28002 RepID=A0ABP1HGM8_9EUKA
MFYFWFQNVSRNESTARGMELPVNNLSECWVYAGFWNTAIHGFRSFIYYNVYYVQQNKTAQAAKLHAFFHFTNIFTFTKSGKRHSTCEEVSKNRISENRQAGFDRTSDSFQQSFTGCFSAHRCFPRSPNSFRESVCSHLQIYQLGQN